MIKRRDHGDGGIDARGENSWRLRYRINGRRFTKTVHGSSSDARKELRRLIRSGDSGNHVAPDKMTLGQWIEHWLAIGAPGKRRRREVGPRSLERYTEMLCLHVVPALGARPLQQLQSTEIDALYEKLAEKLSGKTLCDLHSVLGACMATAYRTRKLLRDPMLELAKVPSPGEINHGTVLEEDRLRLLIQGFKGSPLFLIVATAAFTGARRNEILALRWTDLSVADKTLRIERALEETKEYGLRLKPSAAYEPLKSTMS
jgi:integrase